MCAICQQSNGTICRLQFVNLRVLRLAQDDPLVWQRALLKAEVGCCSGCHRLHPPVCSFGQSASGDASLSQMAISCSASSSQAQLTALAQAEEVLSGARSQRNADMHVHASDAVQRAWRAASGGAADEQEVC